MTCICRGCVYNDDWRDCGFVGWETGNWQWLVRFLGMSSLTTPKVELIEGYYSHRITQQAARNGFRPDVVAGGAEVVFDLDVVTQHPRRRGGRSGFRQPRRQAINWARWFSTSTSWPSTDGGAISWAKWWLPPPISWPSTNRMDVLAAEVEEIKGNCPRQSCRSVSCSHELAVLKMNLPPTEPAMASTWASRRFPTSLRSSSV
jgi:hypothetical protein